MLRFYLKRIMKSRLFLFCLGITVFVLLFGTMNILLVARECAVHNEAISIMESLHATLDFGGFFCVIAPALMSITPLYFFTEDLEKRAVYYQMIRGNRKSYYLGQIVSAMITTSLMIVIGLIVFVCVCTLNGVSWEHNGYWIYLFEGTNTEAYYYGAESWKITLWHLIVTVFYCLPWSLLGMVVSLITKNRYVVMASPFVIFMLWNYISHWLTQSIPKLVWVQPTKPLMLTGVLWEENWSITLTIVYPVLYHCILIGGLSLVYLLITRRRYLREGL